MGVLRAYVMKSIVRRMSEDENESDGLGWRVILNQIR